MKTKTKKPSSDTAPPALADIYARITERIITLLEQGVNPWSARHFVPERAPMNFKSGMPYQGVNVLMLGMQRYASPYWLTYLQTHELGGQVRKGESGSLVVKFGRSHKAPDDDTHNTEERPRSSGRGYLKGFWVFNAAQIDGIDFPEAPPRERAQDDGRSLTEASRVVSNMPNPPEIREGRKARASYCPQTDTVDMPDRTYFRSDTLFYHTLFHELAHSTGHPSRLARKSLMENKGMGSTGEDRKVYSLEELVAEMTAAFVAGHAGILGDEEMENSAAYLNAWITVLKSPDKSRWIVSAASKAQQASNFILDISPATPPTDAC